MRPHTFPLRTAQLLLAAVVFCGGFAFAEEPKRVSKTEALQAVVTKVQPEYPAIGRQLRLQGTVEVEATIAEDGKVESVKELSGNSILAKAAASALKKWQFKPFQQDGKPTKAMAAFSFNFVP